MQGSLISLFKLRLLPIVAASFLLVSCSSVDVVKVPTPTQYVVWTDQMQREADAITGFRFYLPRPFINVIESFPIGAKVYIANGRISADGKFISIQSLKDVESGSVLQLQTPGAAIPTQDVIVGSKTRSTALSGGTQFQSGEESTARETVPSTPRNQSNTQTTTATTSSPPVTSISKQASTNDNGAFAYLPMRGNFDVVYLPDFEEQYAIEKKERMTNLDFQVNFGQGWSLQGFNSITDNTQVVERVFDLADVGLDLLKSAAGDIPIPKLAQAPGTIDTFQPQSDAPRLSQDNAGYPVTLKVVVLEYAAKGLYPVIKPRELQQRTLITTDYFRTWDLFHWSPQTTDAVKLDTAALGIPFPNASRIDSTIPVYPYQYISFNTFKYVAIELVGATDDAFGVLYDQTGTTGVGGSTTSVDDFLRLLEALYPKTPGAGDKEPPPKADPCEDTILITKGAKFEIEGLKLEVSDAETIGDSDAEPCVALTLTASNSIAKIVPEAEIAKLIKKNKGLDFSEPEKKLSISNYTELKSKHMSAQPIGTIPSSLSQSSSEDIRKIQSIICLPAGKRDGKWGEQSQRALEEYQAKNSLPKVELTVQRRDQMLESFTSEREAQAACDNVPITTAFANDLRGKSFEYKELTYTVLTAIPKDNKITVSLVYTSANADLEDGDVSKLKEEVLKLNGEDYPSVTPASIEIKLQRAEEAT